jgi:hypothetical protein
MDKLPVVGLVIWEISIRFILFIVIPNGPDRPRRRIRGINDDKTRDKIDYHQPGIPRLIRGPRPKIPEQSPLSVWFHEAGRSSCEFHQGDGISTERRNREIGVTSMNHPGPVLSGFPDNQSNIAHDVSPEVIRFHTPLFIVGVMRLPLPTSLLLFSNNIKTMTCSRLRHPKVDCAKSCI